MILQTIDHETPQSRLWTHALNTPVMDGGQWSMFASIVSKYGLAPKSAYPDNHNASNTAIVNWILNNKLRQTVAQFYADYTASSATIEELRRRKLDVMQDLYCTLCCLFGEPVTQFTWFPYNDRCSVIRDSPLLEYAAKDGIYTPQSFAEVVVFGFGFGLTGIAAPVPSSTPESAVPQKPTHSSPPESDVGVRGSHETSSAAAAPAPTATGSDDRKQSNAFQPTDPRTWVTFVNDPRHPYNTLLTVEYLGSIWHPVAPGEVASCVQYINVPSSTLVAFTTLMLQKYQQPVWFGCDSSKFAYRKDCVWDPHVINFSRTLGHQMAQLDPTFSKRERILFHETCMTHAMVFTGVHINGDGAPVRFRVENSWGDVGDNSGYFSMSVEWFHEFVFQIAMPRECVPDSLGIDINQILSQDPIVLPPWDPMGALAL
uniref:Bleomycin hydrolase n=1 Tax=Lygus hesperus TaxID=30085 RepID=A0A0A9W717_LYGHE